MSEGGDYSVSNWSSGHDYSSARTRYTGHAGRSYKKASTPKPRSHKKVTASSTATYSPAEPTVSRDRFLESAVQTDCENPLVIACDVTKSMLDWPAVMFGKLPYFEHEAKEYLGKDLEICFAGIGDAYWDVYPLQVRSFGKGKKNLEKSMMELIIEQGGGPPIQESYELAALYFANNCKMPKAIKPLFIFIGDETPYDFIANDLAKKWTGVDLKKRTHTMQVMRELQKKFSVYMIRKPIIDKTNPQAAIEINMRVQSQWEQYLGLDHIVVMPKPERVVDCIFGIMAKETGRIEYFEQELNQRQLPDVGGKQKVETVMVSLETVHHPQENHTLDALLQGMHPGVGNTVHPGKTRMGLGNSVLAKPGRGIKTKKLL